MERIITIDRDEGWVETGLEPGKPLHRVRFPEELLLLLEVGQSRQYSDQLFSVYATALEAGAKMKWEFAGAARA